MQIYLGDKSLDYSGIKLGSTNIQEVNHILENPYTQAFISATGITDQTQINAINDLVNGMVANGIWEKMYAVYPFVGGTATTHKFNLINPQDTNAAFRINFVSGWTHNSNGVTGNGTTTTASTYFNFTTSGVTSFAVEGSLGVYCRNNTTVGYDLSAFDIGTNQIGLISRYINGNFYAGIPIDNSTQITTATSAGLSVASRINTSTVQGYKNATQVINATIGLPANVTNPCILGNTTDSAAPTNRNYAFAFIGRGLTSSDVSTYYTLIQNYQIALGRQV